MTSSSRSSDEARPNGSTSRSLLEDARHANPGAWERLVALYAPLVAHWCRGWGIAEQDRLDVVQEVFSAVATHLERFRRERPSDTFRGWLLTIARTKACDHHRRAAHQPAATGGTDAFVRLQQVLAPQSPESPHDPADGPEFSLVLARALDAIRGEFHERTWQAFWGAVVEGRTAGDVAADLSMSAGAVRVAKSRVLLRLRRELGDGGE